MSVTEIDSPETDATAGSEALPIREVARRTGVNPVTLRAWERRYGLLVPARTGKGHRLYTAADVERIREIQVWLARGVPIGKVRPLLEGTEGGGLAESPAVPEDSWAARVQETLDVAGRFDPPGLRHHLDQLFSAYPPALLLDRWLVPLHRELSRRSRFGGGVLRAFFWEQLSAQLAVATRAAQKNLGKQRQASGKRLVLVSFPGADQQAFAQLFAVGLLAAGIEVVSLGPLEEMAELPYAVEKLRATGALCFSHNAVPIVIFGSAMGRALRNMRAPVWFGGEFVQLQKRDLARIASSGNGVLLPPATGEAIEQLRGYLS
ncbi:MerR family transcriptional regulator [Microbulbifer yueqingensis]|uniref:Transcriptional regulator, MerR family n=1 Tax=Microbulbifer yueqingensis TaxID=658219 RepID=A0A1G8VV59_9GAMM|nr:MerR family transcriptional regulator [Microbulbifer yueqingensis]SDJ69859.1 transcriptional regulator, MerR family [Microbulbifer yueqingensis]